MAGERRDDHAERLRHHDKPVDLPLFQALRARRVKLPFRHRKHAGLSHEKLTLLRGQKLTIFGSSNWTSSSAEGQHEHNLFTADSTWYAWAVDHFERKWNSNETKPFVPLPPDAPAYTSPANDSVDQPTSMTLRWEGGPWAHKFDIYFGTTPNPPLIAADQVIGRVDNGVPESFTLPPLAAGTTYFWRIVGKTMAFKTASSSIRRFTTAGTVTQPPAGDTIVLWTANVSSARIHGR